MKTLNLLDSYENADQYQHSQSTIKRRGKGNKSKSCWRQIERLKEQRQLLRQIGEFDQEHALDALEAAFL